MTQVDQNSFAYNVISSIAAYVGVIPNPENIEQIIVDVKAKVDELKETTAILVKEKENLLNDITELKKEVKAVTDSNASIADLYKKKCEEDSIAIDQGLKASNLFSDLKNHIWAMAAQLRISTKKDDPKEMVERILDEVIKISNLKKNLERKIKFDSPSEPTVSQAIAAVDVKRKPNIFVRLRNFVFVQK